MSTHHTPESRAAIADAKARAAAALTACGDSTSPFESVNVLKLHCARRFFPRNKYESTVDYFNRVAEAAAHPRPKYRGVIASARDIDIMHRPEYHPELHLRAAEIDALPSALSVHGVGNGREGTTQFVRGK